MAIALPRGRSISAFGWLRIGLRLSAMLGLLLLCVPLHYCHRVLRIHNPWPRVFLGGVAWIAGVALTFRGQKVRRGAFLIANHVSWIDIFAVNALTPVAFVSKDDVLHWPIIGTLSKYNETIFLQRGSRGHAHTIGREMAERLQSEHFRSTHPGPAVHIQAVWADLNEARQNPEAADTDVLMVAVNNLSDSSAQQILDLSAQLSARQTVVLYGFGQMKAIDSLARAGCLLYREPLNDAALANIVRSTRPALTDASWGLPHLNDPVPPRQFSDAVLQRVANIPSQVLCECPRHVAELIGQLGRFEDYSLDCLQQSPKDSELHTQLHKMAGTARALLEKALQMVADHEGISLQDPT